MSVIDSAVFEHLGEIWREGRLRYNYLSEDETVVETVAYYENGQLRFCYPVLDGSLHGVGHIWNESGKLLCEEHFLHGRLHGVKKEWRPNGSLRYEITYHKGEKHGLLKEWYEDGTQSFEMSFHEDTVQGRFIHWHPNGVIRRQCFFVQGHLQGWKIDYHHDGSVKNKTFYIRGVLMPDKIQRLISTERLSAYDIIKISNTAVRRICLEELGYARFLAQMPHVIIDQDGDRELVRINWHKSEKAIYLVKVMCSSTGAYYALRVPPSVTNARQAVAWNFGMRADQYQPEVET